MIPILKTETSKERQIYYVMCRNKNQEKITSKKCEECGVPLFTTTPQGLPRNTPNCGFKSPNCDD